MRTKNDITEKLKKLVAGATLMTGIAIGSGCGQSQQPNIAPKEDVVNDEDENIINDKDEPIKHNDTDNLVNDADNTDKNDKDEPIEKNDEDTPSENNDQDEIEPNDNNDPNPHEDDNWDDMENYYYITAGFTPQDLVALKDEIDGNPEKVNENVQNIHDNTKSSCPGTWQNNGEQYDENGNLYIVDTCKLDLDNLQWLENVAPRVWKTIYGLVAPIPHRIVSMKVNHMKNGSPSNVQIRRRFITYDVNVTSANCLGQISNGTSVIEIQQSYLPTLGCSADGQTISEPLQTKSVPQAKDIAHTGNQIFCNTMPNNQYDAENEICYATIEEFIWLENVPHRLFNLNYLPDWISTGYEFNRIERHLDTGIFHLDMNVKDTTIKLNMNLQVELKNAKICMDQCRGQEDCTVYIEPTPKASDGCFINGESAQRLKPKQYDFKHKMTPRFNKPTPIVSKQFCAQKAKNNHQKWSVRNVRNFGRNGR